MLVSLHSPRTKYGDWSSILGHMLVELLVSPPHWADGYMLGRRRNAGNGRYKRLVTGLKARLPSPTHNLSIPNSAEDCNFLVNAWSARSDKKSFLKYWWHLSQTIKCKPIPIFWDSGMERRNESRQSVGLKGSHSVCSQQWESSSLGLAASSWKRRAQDETDRVSSLLGSTKLPYAASTQIKNQDRSCRPTATLPAYLERCAANAKWWVAATG